MMQNNRPTSFTNRWMTRFYVLFNNISVILGQSEGDDERLCAVETCLRSKTFLASNGYRTRDR